MKQLFALYYKDAKFITEWIVANRKNDENKSKDDLIKIFNVPKTKISLSKKKIRDIKEGFNELRYKFFKPKINEIIRSLYNIKNTKNLFKSKIKKIEKDLLNLGECLSELKKYYDYDHIEYKGIE